MQIKYKTNYIATLTNTIYKWTWKINEVKAMWE